MADVRLTNVSKHFGSVVANDNINVHIKDGEFYVLLGPSGCGKSTMLRIVAGLETPDTGEVYIGDRLVNYVPPSKRNAAMVFQSYALYPHKTVFENIAFPLRIAKLPKDDIRNKVDRAMRLLRIRELAERKPSQLSGGQRQRVAVGRALVRVPEVFLLDEPLSNLDALLRVRMRTELKKLQKEIKTTTIYVTHDQAEAMTMADRIAIMRMGKIEQEGTPDEIYNHPSKMFAAGFVGSPPMNFMDGSVEEKGERLYINIGPSLIEVPSEVGRRVKEMATSSEVVFGIRPEDVIIRKKKAPGTLKSEVYVVEPLGSELLVNLEIGEQLIKARASPSLILEMGERVWIRFRKGKIHIFDKKTEKTIV